MAAAFGTSGLRGRVEDLDPATVARWVGAFLASCATGGRVFVGRDLRASSPAIAAAVIDRLRRAGVEAVDCGACPTPVLALAATGAGAIMVTGSHIPADRNGLKFYGMAGEITKAEEAAMVRHADTDLPEAVNPGPLSTFDPAPPARARLRGAFGPEALSGLRIGVWQQSSVARDLLVKVLTDLGAQAVPFGRAGHFVAIDTEAVTQDLRDWLAREARAGGFDAIVSTDGDGDRPLVADEVGRVIPGDILGLLCARALGAERIVTTVTANSALDVMAGQVDRVRIGSPHVIAGLAQILRQAPDARVLGFEPNGGVLLPVALHGPAGRLSPLPTRDALLPIVAVLALRRAAEVPLGQLVAALPVRATAADRLTEIDRAAGAALLEALGGEGHLRADVLDGLPPVLSMDRTDGLRLTLDGGAVLHLRLSGNAPEFRVYTEAATPEAAEALLAHGLRRVATLLAEEGGKW